MEAVAGVKTGESVVKAAKPAISWPPLQIKSIRLRLEAPTTRLVAATRDVRPSSLSVRVSIWADRRRRRVVCGGVSTVRRALHEVAKRFGLVRRQAEPDRRAPNIDSNEVDSVRSESDVVDRRHDLSLDGLGDGNHRVRSQGRRFDRDSSDVAPVVADLASL